ncbi:MAG TPA: carboxypeptidase-like regulatory domain-containing protein [Gemmataceae bacterium]|nr:carboxypeptidase-like regulatory domain-containing protein [Gemmataceae bacterium]
MVRTPRRSAVLRIVLTTILLTPQAASAHALGFSCKLLGNLVRVDAYFSDDTPAIDALVVVRNGQNDIVAQGRTDDHGVWAFARPAAAHYEVTVDAGAGHRKTERLTIPEQPGELESQGSVVSEGPLRDEFTRIPWLRLTIGLAAIFLAAAGWLGRTKIARYKASRS